MQASSVLCAIAMVGCTTAEMLAVPEPVAQSRVTRESYQRRAERLNILFVVDPTAAFATHQGALVAAVRDLAAQLDTFQPPEQLILRVGAIAATDTAVLGSVVEDAYALDGDHVTNYRGSLGDALAAALPPGPSSGTAVQPLAALDRVLAAQPAFFARAATRIVIVTSGDDASSTDPAGLADRLRAVRGERNGDLVLVVTDGETPRLDALVEQFSNHARRSSWITTPGAELFEPVTQFWSSGYQHACRPDRVPDPALCNMWADDTTPYGVVQRVIPTCPTAKGACWRFEVDPIQGCRSGGILRVDREVASELGTRFVIECVTQS